MSIVNLMHRRRYQRAIAVHDKLREWCEDFSGSRPIPSVTISGYYVQIAIGEVAIWDSEQGFGDPPTENSDDEVTFERCVAAYKRLIADMSQWPDE